MCEEVKDPPVTSIASMKLGAVYSLTKKEYSVIIASKRDGVEVQVEMNASCGVKIGLQTALFSLWQCLRNVDWMTFVLVWSAVAIVIWGVTLL